jgi:hypothetical protein
MSEHKQIIIDSEKAYESNTVDAKLIVYFAGGLFLLIVVTFALMWAFEFWVLEPQWAEYDKKNELPVALKGDEKLPPEPRLQSAPGFGVDTKSGRVSLELREPQAEYRELLKRWEDEWANGQKDEKTGTVITLPIEEAKEKILKDGIIKSRSDEASKKAVDEATSFYTSSSSGRVASERRK